MNFIWFRLLGGMVEQKYEVGILEYQVAMENDYTIFICQEKYFLRIGCAWEQQQFHAHVSLNVIPFAIAIEILA